MYKVIENLSIILIIALHTSSGGPIKSNLRKNTYGILPTPVNNSKAAVAASLLTLLKDASEDMGGMGTGPKVERLVVPLDLGHYKKSINDAIDYDTAAEILSDSEDQHNNTKGLLSVHLLHSPEEFFVDDYEEEYDDGDEDDDEADHEFITSLLHFAPSPKKSSST